MARGRFEGTIELSFRQASLLRAAIQRKFPPTQSAGSFECAAVFLIDRHRTRAKDALHLGKRLARALGRQRSRRVLTSELKRHFELVLGEAFVRRILALKSGVNSGVQRLARADRERELVAYQGLKEKGLYAACIEFAQPLSTVAAAANNYVESAEWKAREFSCLRSLGRLTEALRCGNEALALLDHAPATERRRPEALLLALRLQFGVTIASVTMQAADFGAGLRAHRKNERQATELSRRFSDTTVGKEAKFYVLHARRQQAECLRYLGRYSDALAAARELENAYPVGDAQPRFWARVYQADNLRLLGFFDEARDLLVSLEEIAVLRRQQAGPVAVLWRRLAMESLADPAQVRAVAARLECALADESRGGLWGASYAHLALAADRVYDPARCQDHLEAFSRASEGSVYVLEEGYAHLIRAEMERGRHHPAAACTAYKAAGRSFERGGVQWGTLRARIGIVLTCRKVTKPRLPLRLDGLDKNVSQACRSQSNMEIGVLCRNFP